MKAIDSIIESAQSEEDLQEKLIRVNKTLHGKAAVDSAIDMAQSPEELTDAMVSLARKKRVTKEDQNQVLQTIYRTIRAMGTMAKPLDLMLTPATEMARYPLKKLVEFQGLESQTPDVDILSPGRDLGNLSPTFGLSAFITDLSNAMGIKQGPTANFNETEFAAEYPIAANILSELTNPANIGAMAIEGLVAGKIPSRINAPIQPKDIIRMQDWVSDKYLSAIQKDSKLSQALKDTGKWNDVVRYFSLNKEKLITPFNKEKALNFLEGPIRSVEDLGGQTSSYRDTSSGEIGRLMDEQENILNKIPSDKFTIDPVTLRESAYEKLSPELIESQKTKAQQLIDETIPYYDYDQNKISALQKVADSDLELQRLNNEISNEQNIIEDAIQKKKLEEFLGLKNIDPSIPNPQYREDLQWLSKLPVVEGDNIFPKTRTEYVTDITYPNDPSYLGQTGAGPRQSQQITTVDEAFKTAKPTIGQNEKLLDIALGKQNQPPMIDNPNYYAKKAEIDQKILLLNNEIESVRKLNMSKPENYNKLSKLMKEKAELQSFVRLNTDPMFSLASNPVESYKQYIFDTNQMPAGSGTSVRRRGNKLIEGSKMNQSAIDSGAEQAAGLALSGAGSEAERAALGFLDSEHDINQFYGLKNEQALALKSRDLLTGNRVNRPAVNGVIPVGDPTRGIIREIISMFPQYAGPVSMDAINWMNNMAQRSAQVSVPYAPVSGLENMAQPSPNSPTNFIPRGIPLQDPMMKAHAIDAIGRDKQNTPARNAERMMKIINEGIFED